MTMRTHFLARAVAVTNVILLTASMTSVDFETALRMLNIGEIVSMWMLLSSMSLVVHLVTGLWRTRNAQELLERKQVWFDLLFGVAWFGIAIFFILKNLPILFFFAG